MAKTIFIGARKGGVGKTVTTASLGVGLARAGKKTLVIDADSQYSLLARKRSKEDKDRTHRLCRRGGKVEKLLPGLIRLTDEQFDTWVNKTLLSGFAEKIINELSPPPAETGVGADTAQGGGSTTTKPAEAAAQSSTPPTAKPAQAPQNGGTNGNAHGGNGTSQNNGGNAPRHANQPHNNTANGNAHNGNNTRQTG